MKKSQATKQLQKFYQVFSENAFRAIFLKLDFPNTLDYLKLEKEIRIKTFISEGELTKAQLNANLKHLEDYLEEVDKYPKVFFPMILIYIVSSFEVYLKEVTKLLLKYDKRVIADSEKSITYKTLMQYTNYDDLLDFIAVKYVHDMGYKSIEDQIMFLNRKIHINLSFKRAKGLVANRRYVDLNSIVEIFATRNIVLHNGGEVNDIYIDRIESTTFKKGEERVISSDYLLSSFGSLRHAAEAILRQSKIFVENFGKEK